MSRIWGWRTGIARADEGAVHGRLIVAEPITPVRYASFINDVGIAIS
jgi:hypothetical protein